MRTTAVCLFLLLTRMHAAEPNADAWLAQTKIAPPLKVSASLEAWQQQRGEIRAKLNELLGDLPPRPPVSAFQVIAKEDKGTYSLETIQFDNGAGEMVKGFLFIPKMATAQTQAPAILYCHWHGGQYDIGKNELLGMNATPVAPGPALAEAGYVVLGIDAPCFGERNGQGPDGPQQKGSAGEMTAAKFHLWAGRTLWGMILRDDLTALDYLCSRPEVDAARIGVTGISMGSTRSWWLMALDDRPRAAVCVACMTRYEELIRAGMLKAHGIYYFVPGMLKHFDTEAVIALAAPRPMLFMTGDQDGGSPIEGVKHLGKIVNQVYAQHGSDKIQRFENTIYPGIGHGYVPEMWDKTVKWLDRWVKAP
ncbi:MAG: dienelactone hydrolase family protein [Verrucomicrobia bacterium]|nr:dienelactone hydrolase family protein [Verrucomicrobiota bacterium]